MSIGMCRKEAWRSWKISAFWIRDCVWLQTFLTLSWIFFDKLLILFKIQFYLLQNDGDVTYKALGTEETPDIWLFILSCPGGITQGWLCLAQAQTTASATVRGVCMCMCDKSLQSCLTLQHARLHCSWDSPGKSTGVGCHALLQGIFLTQGSNHVSCVSCIDRQFHYH